MMTVNSFSKKTQEELKHYVYALIDPRNNKIFYVGKGQGNRVFSHVNGAVESPKETDKLKTIREIKRQNKEVRHFIIRHGLDEHEAFLVESVLIDFFTFRDFSEVAKITNISAGHHSFDRGIKTVKECEALYNCETLNNKDIKHNILIINVNRTYSTGKRKNKNSNYDRPNIYEATRGWWVLDIDRAKKVDYVLAEYKGVIRAVFQPEKWLQNPDRGNKRWGFEGKEVADQNILFLYDNKEVQKTKGAANPIRYLDPLSNHEHREIS